MLRMRHKYLTLTNMKTSNPQAPVKQNPFMDLIFTIVLPSFVMMKFSDEKYLGPVWGVIVALAIPLFFGLYDFSQKKKINVMSIVGLCSVFLTGGFSLFELDAHWIAVKEATIPGVIGLVVLLSLKSKTPLVRKIILNGNLFHADRIESALHSSNNKVVFEKRLVQSTCLLSLSFFVSSFLNYVLAKWFLVSQPGTSEFAIELGKMTAMSYPIVVLPSLLMMGFTLFFLFSNIRKLTGLEFNDLVRR
jgi:hypothetical protein